MTGIHDNKGLDYVVEMIRMSAVLEVQLGAAVLSLIIETQAVETMKQLEVMRTQKSDDLGFWLIVETVPTFQTEVK